MNLIVMAGCQVMPFDDFMIETVAFYCRQTRPNPVDHYVRCLLTKSHFKIHRQFRDVDGGFDFGRVQFELTQFVGQGQFVIQNQVAPASVEHAQRLLLLVHQVKRELFFEVPADEELVAKIVARNNGHELLGILHGRQANILAVGQVKKVFFHRADHACPFEEFFPFGSTDDAVDENIWFFLGHPVRPGPGVDFNTKLDVRLPQGGFDDFRGNAAHGRAVSGLPGWEDLGNNCDLLSRSQARPQQQADYQANLFHR